MIFNLSISFVFILYLIVINFFFKKFNFGLDVESEKEKHKSLLRDNNSTPLSGTLYFLPVIIIVFYNSNYLLIICCSLLFFLGFCSDLKIITSYRKRLIIQFIIISTLFLLNEEIIINTRIQLIDNLMNSNFTRILLCSFFFMVLINGYNLIDGTNCLSSLNFLIVIIFIILIINNLNIEYVFKELSVLLIALFIFSIFNFFGKNFLGDGAVYGLGFLLGYTLLEISLKNSLVSPYFVAHLLWYPAFENLFSIMRRSLSKKNNYLADNDHLHHLIFKFMKKKKIIKKDILISSLIGVFVNFILLINYFVGYIYYSHSWIQIVLILCGIIVYLISYYVLQKKLS